MGVPGAAKYFKEKKQAELPPKSVLNNVVSLQIDANALAHGSKVDVYGADMSAPSSPENLKLHAQGVVEDILELVEKFKPKGYVHLAWDGVPVGAKIKQQRERRIFHKKRRDVSVDPNIITTGTNYMRQLEKEIKRLIKSAAVSAALPPKIVFSSSSVPGEGEHKIADDLRQQPDGPDDGYHIVEGADADLFFIIAIVGKKNVWAHRGRDESMKYVSPEYSVSSLQIMEKCREMSGESFNNYEFEGTPEEIEIQQLEITQRAAVKALAMWCVLGNDFMPALPTLVVFEPTIERLSSYVANLELVTLGRLLPNEGNPSRRDDSDEEEEDELVLTNGDRYVLNYEAYREYIALIAQDRQKFINDVLKRKKKQPDRLLNEILELHQDARAHDKHWPRYFGTVILNNMDEFDQLTSSLRTTGLDLEVARMNKATRDYAITLDWVLAYYQLGVNGIDQDWYYPYQHAPTASYMTKVMDQVIDFDHPREVTARVHEQEGELGTFTPLHQVLAALPSSSSDLLPFGARTWMDKNGILGDIYPASIIVESTSTDGESHLDVKHINMPSMKRIREYVAYLNRDPKAIDYRAFDREQVMVIDNQTPYSSSKKKTMRAIREDSGEELDLTVSKRDKDQADRNIEDRKRARFGTRGRKPTADKGASTSVLSSSSRKPARGGRGSGRGSSAGRGAAGRGSSAARGASRGGATSGTGQRKVRRADQLVGGDAAF